MESPKKRFDRVIFFAGVLGILTFTGLQFQNCAGTTGKQTIPCVGKNCIKPTPTGSGLNPTTGGDSGGGSTGPSYNDYPATGTCKLTIDLGKDRNNEDVLASDAEKNYTLDQATNSITQIVSSTGEYRYSMPMQGPMGSETDYFKYCMKQGKIKVDQLDSTLCLKSKDKKINYTITIGAIMKDGTPRQVDQYVQLQVDCKGRPLISAKSNYIWPADKNPLFHSDPSGHVDQSFLSFPPNIDPQNPSEFCLNEWGCFNSTDSGIIEKIRNLYQNGGMFTRLYVNQYNTNYLNYLLYEKFNTAWTVKIKKIKFDAYYKVVPDASASFADCPDKKNDLQIWYTTTTTGLPNRDGDTFFNVVEVPNIPTAQFRTIDLPAQTFQHPVKPRGFFFFKTCNAMRLKNLEIELY